MQGQQATSVSGGRPSGRPADAQKAGVGLRHERLPGPGRQRTAVEGADGATGVAFPKATGPRDDAANDNPPGMGQFQTGDCGSKVRRRRRRRSYVPPGPSKTTKYATRESEHPQMSRTATT